MVKLWPFGGESSDAAAFEKTLSALAQKIQKNGTKLDRLRYHSRKFKVVWSVYTSMAYMIVALILTLVTGWQNWGKLEVSGLAAGPVIIYGVRQGLTAIYEYRIRNASEYQDSLLKERDATIEKLKTATKYNSTQQLLEKYGSVQPSQNKPSSPNQQPRKQQDPAKNSQSQPQSQPARVQIAPPATANIPRNLPRPISTSGPSPGPQLSPQHLPRPLSSSHASLPSPSTPSLPPPPSADFAPNAFAPIPAYPSSPKWYDRILDVLVGEDETAPHNRFALICAKCRLVNGLAPPGTRRLEEVGRWKCSSCGAGNGGESVSEVGKGIAEVLRGREKGEEGMGESAVLVEKEVEVERLEADEDEEEDEDDGDVGDAMDVDVDATPAQSTRSRRRGKNT